MNTTQLESKLKMMTRMLWCALTVCLGLIATQNVRAATWTNTPVSADWTNTLNWYGGVPPGTINPAAASLDTGTATFTNALSGGIGGSGNPINNDDQRDIKFLFFDGANCGAYVIGNNNGNRLQVTSTGSGTGNITVNTPVANPIVINAPLYTRLASSTSGFYSFINNAANPSATLSISIVTNSSASSRPMNFILDGGNTGSNTIGHIDDFAGTGGAILLLKQGAGTWVLTGTNDMPQKTSTATSGSGVASVAVTAGKLEVQNVGSLGGITMANLTVTNTGTLQIDGVTLINGGITLNNGGTIKMNGSGTVNGVTVGTVAATSATLATTGLGDVLTVGISANKLTGGASDTVLHVAGPGTVSLTNAANYVGKWSVDAGTLSVANATALGSGGLPTIIGAGATLDVSPLGAVTYTALMGLTANGTGTGVGTTAATIKANSSAIVDLTTGSKPLSLTITPTTFNGDTAHPALYVSQGTLALNGNVFTINNAAATPLGLGTYTLISQATGSVTSSGTYTVTAVTGTGLTNGTSASIQVTGGNVNLVVSPYVGVALKWQGDGVNNYWDTSTANFTNGAGAAVKFSQGDFPTFDDTSVNPTVNLFTTVQPGQVTVTANVNNYLFNDATGSGVLSGTGGITKNGFATLTIVAANVNIGPTVINGGTLQVGTNGTKGDLGGGIVTNNGALVFYQSNSHSQSSLITGTGSLTQKGAGTLTLTANNTYSGPTIITNGTLQVGTNGATGSLGSGVITNDGTLVFNRTGSIALGNVKTGPGLGGYVTFNGAATVSLSGGNTYYNNTVIANGLVKLAASEAIPSYVNLGYTYGWLTMDGGATTAGTLDLNGFNQSVNALSGLNSTVNSLITNSATTGTNILTVGGGVITTSASYNGVIQDNGTNANGGQIALRLLGANTSLTLTKANPYNGGTIVGGGSLTLNNNAGAGTGSITLSNGAALTLTGNGMANSIFVAAGAMATNSVTLGNSANLGNSFSSGDTNSVLVFVGSPSVSQGSSEQFSGFLGTVLIPTGNGLRFSATTLDDNGGANTTFEIEGGINCRNNMSSFGSVQLGALTGAGTLSGGSQGFVLNDLFIIGAKNIDSTFGGTITNGSFCPIAITKVGTGKQTFSGTLAHTGKTTISGGTLALVGTTSLDSVSSIALSSATVDVSGRGDGKLNLGVSTNQTLTAIGTVNGSLYENANSFVSVGLGTLNVTGAATLNGGVTLQLNRTNVVTHSEITASGFTIGAAATLTVTNVGQAIQTNDTFQLFSGPVSGFAATNLPVLTGVLQWENDLAVNGSIKAVAPGSSTIAPTHSAYIGGFTLSGNDVLMTGTNGDIGATYYLLAGTNLTLSLPQWKTVATNVAGASNFTFTFTNAAIPYVNQKFYILSSTNYNP